MKALELNNLLGMKEVNMKKFRKKLENVKACTDTSAVSVILAFYIFKPGYNIPFYFLYLTAKMR